MYSVIKISSCLYLVSLRSEILLSSTAQVFKSDTIFPEALTPHIYSRDWATIHTRGISAESEHLKYSLISLLAVTDWSWCRITERSQLPVSTVLLH